MIEGNTGNAQENKYIYSAEDMRQQDEKIVRLTRQNAWMFTALERILDEEAALSDECIKELIHCCDKAGIVLYRLDFIKGRRGL